MIMKVFMITNNYKTKNLKKIKEDQSMFLIMIFKMNI